MPATVTQLCNQYHIIMSLFMGGGWQADGWVTAIQLFYE